MRLLHQDTRTSGQFLTFLCHIHHWPSRISTMPHSQFVFFLFSSPFIPLFPRPSALHPPTFLLFPLLRSCTQHMKFLFPSLARALQHSNIQPSASCHTPLSLGWPSSLSLELFYSNPLIHSSLLTNFVSSSGEGWPSHLAALVEHLCYLMCLKLLTLWSQN